MPHSETREHELYLYFHFHNPTVIEAKADLLPSTHHTTLACLACRDIIFRHTGGPIKMSQTQDYALS